MSVLKNMLEIAAMELVKVTRLQKSFSKTYSRPQILELICFYSVSHFLSLFFVTSVMWINFSYQEETWDVFSTLE